MLSLLYSTVLLYFICFCFVLSCTLLIGGNKEILLLLLLIKEAKFYFPKLALGEANFVDRCPRLSNTAREVMYTRTGRRSGVMPG